MLLEENKKDSMEETLNSKAIEQILAKVGAVFQGKIIKDERNEIKCQFADSEEAIELKNVSTGLKIFIILQLLLEHGHLSEKRILIIDEVLSHLHPEWQVKFAEILVLLQKECKLYMVLFTHSPYFLRAIEVYSAKYNISECCKYYLAENEGRVAEIRDVTEEIDLIYQKLSRPLQLLEDASYAEEL